LPIGIRNCICDVVTTPASISWSTSKLAFISQPISTFGVRFNLFDDDGNDIAYFLRV